LSIEGLDGIINFKREMQIAKKMLQKCLAKLCKEFTGDGLYLALLLLLASDVELNPGPDNDGNNGEGNNTEPKQREPTEMEIMTNALLERFDRSDQN
jgi:hypothetical protein